MPKKVTHDEFVEKLKLIKPHIEVISKYNGNKNYITVRCTIHDHVWESKPNWLMHDGKCDCQKCYDDRRGETRRNGLDFFIKKGNEIFDDKFYYSKVVYVNNKTKVTIICPEHGEFQTTPEKHLNRKQGCPKCANRNVTTEDFIEKAKKVHGDEYDYSKCEYTINSNQVKIICNIHGVFNQTPDKHLQGHGCPVCRESKLEKIVRGILTNENILFTPQCNFSWLGRQSLDFYLPNFNIAIECQGEQHFEPVDYFGGMDGFIKNVKRDSTKNKLCSNNGIKLIYVSNHIKLLKEIYKNKLLLNIYNKDNIVCDTNNKIEKLLLKKLNEFKIKI